MTLVGNICLVKVCRQLVLPTVRHVSINMMIRIEIADGSR